MQVIRRTSFRATPWKNGGGVTHEIIRVPDAAAFRWRLSIAQIDASGPFSDFAGYQRTLILLRGSGLRLQFDGRDAVSLTRVGAMAQFDGALKTDCRLLDGPCTDLNLMVARSLRPATTEVVPVGERRAVPGLLARSPAGSRAAISLVFSITGSLTVEHGAGPPVHLEPWDLAILPANAAGVVAPDPAQQSSSLVFFATLDDNSP